MERAVLTVDVTNSPAIKTVRRLGFRARASTKLVRWNGWGWASYSHPTVTEHCTFGRYLGDGFKSKSQPFRALESMALC
jgi:hypothetical protein